MLLATATALIVAALNAPTPEASLDVQLENLRQKYGLPGMAALVFREGKGELAAAVGVRKLGADTRVTVQDKWHLGSDTKAMTATLAAMAVEEGKLKWSSTVSEVLTGWRNVDPGYRQITLEMLLGHRGGLPANLSNEGWKKAYNPKSAAKEREAAVRLLLKAAPVKPGEFLYSNAGYMVAGVMIEKALGMPWEAAMKKRLFAPLGMGSCGFGPPASKDTVDQPWAHSVVNEALVPVAPTDPHSDNPLGLGPAGTVHCSLGDWLKFVQLHLDGARGLKTALLKPESFAKLHTAAQGGPYALGWGVSEPAWAAGKLLRHSGSNGLYFVTVWLALAKGVAFLFATNAGHNAAEQASNEAGQLFVEQYAK
ncbi:MAG: beta-lactamase family protein [Myxococcaceae bacterium]|nr:beta-lactamase family protein [Myxococcaceae bacterium]